LTLAGSVIYSDSASNRANRNQAKTMTITDHIAKRKPTSAKLILSIVDDYDGEVTLSEIARHETFKGIRFKRIQDAAEKLAASGKLTHIVDERGDVYTTPDSPEPEDKYTAEKPSSKPVPKTPKKAPAKKAKPAAKKTPAPTPEVPLVDILKLCPEHKGAKHATREDWLLAAVAAVRPLFDEIGADAYPPLRVSCGWPKGGRKAIGQCWPSTRSDDKSIEMFLSPALSDPFQVLHVTVHELIHAIDNCVNSHKGPFRKMAKAIGFEGKMTATVPGAELSDKLRLLLGNLGPYPHATLDASRIKKQGTRMLKVVCTDTDCGYTLRTTKKWIEVGVPTCCCGEEMTADE
jgi:hypothetical protein